MKFELKTGFENMDIIAVHDFLSKNAYWSKNIPFKTVNTALKNSYCFGVFLKKQQVGFARMITDYATFAYLADVYVAEEFRNQGLSKKMMQHCMQLEWVQSIRRFMLATLDAHTLYQQFGFHPVEKPERLMEILQQKMDE